MRLVRWCGRVLVAFGQWFVALVVCSMVLELVPGEALWPIRLYGAPIAALFLTLRYRRRRARRHTTGPQLGQEGAQR